MRPDERRAALNRARLYLVAGPGFTDLAEVVAAGVGIVQLRDKEGDAKAILRTGALWLEACERLDVPFVVNDRPDVAKILGADGVHVGQDDLPPEAVRDIVGPDVIVGLSTHFPDQIADAAALHERGVVDYIAVGPVHETPTKPGRPAVGLDLIEMAARTVTFPWFAIGGISPMNVRQVAAAGADRVVVVRAIVDSPDPAAAATQLMAGLIG
ncbi:MAG TPA: thiamine phosphate synthase, partial [Actinomycetota bacterium]|nr:thiamine phosphate synthase [Actinomycetota bacterium]